MLAPLTANNFKPLSPMKTRHGVLRAPIAGPGFLVEVRKYGFEDPVYGVFQSPSCYVQLTLAQRAMNPVGAYREARADPAYARIGDVMLVPAREPLFTRSDPGEQQSVCCEFDVAKVRAFADIDWSSERLAATLDVTNPRVRMALHRLAEEVLQPGFASDLMVESMVVGLVVELYRQFGAPSRAIEARAGGLAAWQMRRIEDAIEDVAGSAPSIADLADECGVSPRHLMRLFKAAAGVTLGDYVAEARVRRAKALLSSSRPLIKEAAYLCGFKTTAAFSAAFRRATGRTPRQYRQEAAGRRSAARIAKRG